MNFLKKIKSSIYGPVFYNELLSKSLGGSIKYFFGLVTLLTFISTIVLSIQLVPPARSFLASLSDKVVAFYPVELEVVIKDGVATSNVTEPYYVKMPEDVMTEEDKKMNVENILVIDTKTVFTLSDFDSYRTRAVLSKDALVYKKSNGQITVEPLVRMPNATINKTQVIKWMGIIAPYLNALPYLIPVALFVFLFLACLGKFIYLFAGALLIMLVAKMKKASVTYKKAYQLGLHALTLPLIVAVILGVFALHMFFLLSTLLLLLVIAINLKKSITPTPVSAPIAPASPPASPTSVAQ